MILAKQPSALAASLQILLIPAFVLTMTLEKALPPENEFGYIIIFHGIMIFIVHQSNINLHLLSPVSGFFALLMLGIILMLILLPFNALAFNSSVEYQFCRGPIRIAVSSFLSLVQHFPGAKSLVETYNMVQLALLCLLCYEHNYKAAALSYQELRAGSFPANVSDQTARILNCSVELLLLMIPCSLLALKVAKLRIRHRTKGFQAASGIYNAANDASTSSRQVEGVAERTVSEHLSDLLELDGQDSGLPVPAILLLFTLMFAPVGFVFVKTHFLVELVLRPSVAEMLTLRDYFIGAAAFCCLKYVGNRLVALLPGVNVHYNRVHRAIYQAFTRKSYHGLMAYFWFSSRRAEHIFYVTSAVAFHVLCLLEALRPRFRTAVPLLPSAKNPEDQTTTSAATLPPASDGSENPHNSAVHIVNKAPDIVQRYSIFAWLAALPYQLVKLFYQSTDDFVSDRLTQTALNHLQLLLSTSVFPALQHVFSDRTYYLQYTALVTVILADSVAQIAPALYLAATREEPQQWSQTFQRQLACIPVYQGWTMPVISYQSAFQHDLELAVSKSGGQREQRKIGGKMFAREAGTLPVYNGYAAQLAQGKLKICTVGAIELGEFTALLRARTPIGTFAFVIIQMIAMSYLHISPIAVILASLCCGAYEMIGECDNCLTAVVCANFLIITTAE